VRDLEVLQEVTGTILILLPSPKKKSPRKISMNIITQGTYNITNNFYNWNI